MKLRFGIVFALLAVLVLTAFLWCGAQAQVPLTHAGKGAPGGAAACSPTCPGDVVPGADIAWMVARCYKASYVGSHLDIVDAATGNTTGTRLQCASGGVISALVSGSACTFVTGNACSALATTCASACNIVTMYDESGANLCSSAPCNATEATNASRAAYTASAVGGKACATFNGTSSNYTAASFAGLAQPFSFSQYFSAGAANQTMFADGNNVYYGTNSNFLTMQSGSSVGSGNSVAANAYTPAQSIFNGATSVSYYNGTATTSLNPGTDAIAATTLNFGSNSFGTFAAFVDCEFIIYPIALNSTQYGNLTTNQGSFY
jgi:hypothetical protein